MHVSYAAGLKQSAPCTVEAYTQWRKQAGALKACLAYHAACLLLLQL